MTKVYKQSELPRTTMRKFYPGGATAPLSEVVTRIVENAVETGTNIKWFKVLDSAKLMGMNAEVREADLAKLTGTIFEVYYNEYGRVDRAFGRIGTHIATLTVDTKYPNSTEINWEDIEKVDARARSGYDKLAELLDF